MKAIQKEQEPPDLLQYRAQPGAIYDGPLFTPVKEIIREYLLQEQGHLCAYCMRRIEAGSMKIEHWHCQDNYPSKQLAYSNMLGVCFGNEGQPPVRQTCDTRKGNKDLLFNPAYLPHQNQLRIRYKGDGTITSDNPAFGSQLDKILNLNLPRLKSNRKSVLDGIISVINRNPGTCSLSQVNRYITRWTTPDLNGKIKEYYGVAIYYLQKKLNRLI